VAERNDCAISSESLVKTSRKSWTVALTQIKRQSLRGGIERKKCFASLHCTFLEVFVKHLFPTRRVDAGRVSDHTVEVEQDGVVLVTCDCFAHRVILPASTCLSIIAR